MFHPRKAKISTTEKPLSNNELIEETRERYQAYLRNGNGGVITLTVTNIKELKRLVERENPNINEEEIYEFVLKNFSKADTIQRNTHALLTLLMMQGNEEKPLEFDTPTFITKLLRDWKRCGYNRKSAENAFRALEGRGFLKKERNGKGYQCSLGESLNEGFIGYLRKKYGYGSQALSNQTVATPVIASSISL